MQRGPNQSHTLDKGYLNPEKQQDSAYTEQEQPLYSNQSRKWQPKEYGGRQGPDTQLQITDLQSFEEDKSDDFKNSAGANDKYGAL